MHNLFSDHDGVISQTHKGPKLSQDEKDKLLNLRALKIVKKLNLEISSPRWFHKVILSNT